MDDETRGPLRHPLVDGLVAGGVVRHDPFHRLELTPSRADLLLSAAHKGQRVVLHTSPEARMSPALAQALGDVQGRWVVEDATGQLWDGLSGVLVDPTEPFSPSNQGDDIEPTAAPTNATEVLLAASIRHRADISPTYGTSLERFALDLDAEPAFFAPYEPAERQWSQTALVAELNRAAAAKRLFVRGDGPRALRGSLLVRATDRGTEEVVDVAVGVPPRTEDLAARVHSALARIAEDSFVLAAIVLLRPGYADLMRRPGRPAPAAPLAMLIGPTGVRDLAADLDGLAERFGVLRLGRPRTPSLLLPLRGQAGDWEAVEEVVDFIGRDRVEALLDRPLPKRPAG